MQPLLLPKRTLALRGMLRRALSRLHRWSGLVAMACLLVAGITGVWLCFRAELDRAINPHLRVVSPAAARVSADEIVTAVEGTFPGTHAAVLGFQERPDDSVLVSVWSDDARWSFDQVFVNPYTGAVLGTQTTSLVSVARSSFDSLMLGLHYSLFLSAPGIWVMGLAAVVWLLTSIVGVALAWPGAAWHPRSWLPVLLPRWGAGAYKTSYDVHRSAGLWLLPVTIVLAFTSVGLNLPQYVRPGVNRLSPLTPQPPGRRIPLDRARVSFSEAEAIVRRARPSAHIRNIYRDVSNGRYSVYFHMAGDVNARGNNFTYIDLETGAITGTRSPSEHSAGDRFMAWLFPLHTGNAFGWPGRIVIALDGVALVVMNATGLYVWFAKWQMRLRGRSRAEPLKVLARDIEARRHGRLARSDRELKTEATERGKAG